MKAVWVAILLPAFLAGCEKTNTVDYYVNNKADRQERLAECRKNPGDMKKTPNCINAAEAENRVMFNPNNTGMPSIN